MAASVVEEACSSQGLHYRNPRLPSNIKLPDNLECGMKIYVHGGVDIQANKFSINLKDAKVDANTYFHFNPRFNEEKVVVRNSRYNEAWGTEDRDGESPFVPGEDFVVLITATVDGYQVDVNGSDFTIFNHRDDMPLCNVTHLTVSGDIVLYGIHIPLSSVSIPVSLSLPKKICLGDMFFITGEVPSGSDRFAVNFLCGSDDNADIVFHLNPRFGDGEVVCNNKCGDCWNSEERDTLPISPGDSLNLCVATSADAYYAFLNGNSFVKFSHRMDMRAACTMVINGDITIQDLCIDCPASKLAPQAGDENVREFEESVVTNFYPSNPASLALPGPLEVGNVIQLSGIVDADPTRFKVNLQCGEDADADIALHLNPRWDDSCELVLNHRSAGEWGEECCEPNGVAAGSPIHLVVSVKSSGYAISLNGTVLPEFPHRIEQNNVSHLVVDGCLQVQRLMYSA